MWCGKRAFFITPEGWDLSESHMPPKSVVLLPSNTHLLSKRTKLSAPGTLQQNTPSETYGTDSGPVASPELSPFSW